MASPLPRHYRRRSPVVVAIWCVGFTGLTGLAAWQFGWFPGDAGQPPPAGTEAELGEASPQPFEAVGQATAIHGGSAGDSRFDARRDDFPVVLDEQREPTPLPNPQNTPTWREDIAGHPPDDSPPPWETSGHAWNGFDPPPSQGAASSAAGSAVVELQPVEYLDEFDATVYESRPPIVQTGGPPPPLEPQNFETEQSRRLPANHPAAAELAGIDDLIKAGDIKEAHRRLSTIYWKQPEWRAFIAERIDHTAESIYFSNARHYMEPYVIQPGDTLAAIAGLYKVSWRYLEQLNRVPARRIRAGQRLKVIKGPFAVRVDLSNMELTIHAHGWYVRRYDIGIGKDGSTPIGTFHVDEMLVNPVYWPPEGGQLAAGDPANPLGDYWISIGNSYGIHGTNDPASIGKAESRGCLRLANDDAAEVFDFLIRGAEVVIQP